MVRKHCPGERLAVQKMIVSRRPFLMFPRTDGSPNSEERCSNYQAMMYRLARPSESKFPAKGFRAPRSAPWLAYRLT